MRKLIVIITVTIIIAAAGILTLKKYKADMIVEQADFSVTVDTGTSPSAYCMNADGTPLGSDFSNSGYLCIDKNLYSHINHMTYEGEPVYCIGRHTQRSPSSLTQVSKCSDIPLDMPEYSAVLSAAAEGASFRKGIYGLSDYDIYYVTQCALRSIVYGIPSENIAFYDTSGSLNESMTDEFHHLREYAQTPLQETSTEIMFEPCGISAQQILADNRCYYRYGPYKPYTDGSCNSYSLSLDVQSDVCFISSDPSCTHIQNTLNYNFGEAFYIYIDACYTSNVNVNVSAQISTVSYSPVIYLANSSTYQNIARLSAYEKNTDSTAQIVASNNNTCGDIQINKMFMNNGTITEDTSLLSEPRFTVQNSDGLYVNGCEDNGCVAYDSFSAIPTEYKLNPSTSQLIIKSLPIGTYTITETKTPSGYTPEQQTIEVTNTSALDTVTFINNADAVETTTVIETTVTEINSQTSCEESSAVSESSVYTESGPSQTKPQHISASPKTSDKSYLSSVLSLLSSAILMIFTKCSVKTK